jgi:hypothetical protein
MKNNRFARAKSKIKEFFIKFRNKDTSFLIIAFNHWGYSHFTS